MPSGGSDWSERSTCSCLSVASREGANVGFAPPAQVCGLSAIGRPVRISAIVDACFRLIVDGKTRPSRTRRGGAQELRGLYDESCTISLKRGCVLALGLRFPCDFGPLPGRRRRPPIRRAQSFVEIDAVTRDEHANDAACGVEQGRPHDFAGLAVELSQVVVEQSQQRDA
jgi:hypothetical protein